MRQCANPVCRAEITGCSGFFSSRDQLDVLLGTPLEIEQTVELCGFCGAMLNEPETAVEYETLLARILGKIGPSLPQFPRTTRMNAA